MKCWIFLNNGKDKKFKGEKPIAVIFEVIPAKDRKPNYLDIAASLKPELEKIDGFISIERYESLNNPEDPFTFVLEKRRRCC
jgi:hypothetical protein